jgi:hypothetical protein
MRCIKFVDHNFVSAIFKSLANFYWRLPIRNKIEISLQFYLQINPLPIRMDMLPTDCVFIWHYLGKKIITEERIIQEISKYQKLNLLLLRKHYGYFKIFFLREQ